MIAYVASLVEQCRVKKMSYADDFMPPFSTGGGADQADAQPIFKDPALF